MTRIIPKVVLQRETSVLGHGQRLVVRSTIRSRILDIVLGGIVQDMIQERVRVKHQRRHVRIPSRKSRSVLFQRIVPPPNHGRVGQRPGRADHIARRPVQRRQLHEQPLLVSGLVDGLDGLLERGSDQLLVVARKVDVQLGRVAYVVDADPERHERLVRVDNVFEHRLGVVDELLRLVDELHGPVVVQGQILDGDICASKGEVPELDGAGLRVR